MLAGELQLGIMQVGIICHVYGVLWDLVVSGCIRVEFMQVVVSPELRLLLKFKKDPLVAPSLLAIELLLHIGLQFLPLLPQLQILELILLHLWIYGPIGDL